MVPGSARNWIAVNAVQQFSLNQKVKTKNMTTLQLRKSIAVMFISAFAVSASFAAPTDSPQPTGSSGQSSEAQTTRPLHNPHKAAASEMRDMPMHNPDKAAASEMRDMPMHDPHTGKPQANPKRTIAAINRNKNEHDAIVAAVKSQNASEIQAILGR